MSISDVLVLCLLVMKIGNNMCSQSSFTDKMTVMLQKTFLLGKSE